MLHASRERSNLTGDMTGDWCQKFERQVRATDVCTTMSSEPAFNSVSLRWSEGGLQKQMLRLWDTFRLLSVKEFQTLIRMDPNIIAAIISLAGSTSLAGMGAIATWYKNRSRKKSLAMTYAILQTHPVMRLNSDGALVVLCHDAVKCNLLNAIRVDVICTPIQTELLVMLRRLQMQGRNIEIKNIGDSVSLAREQIIRLQEVAARNFPEATQGVIAKLISTHANSLAIASDLFHCLYSAEQAIELVFDIFYVSTFTVLSQWAQTANQLNGQLNGVWWEEQCIGYSFGGNVTDALRILNPAVIIMHEALGSQDCCAVLVDDRNYILGCCGSQPCFGFSMANLIGMSLAAFQFGVEDLDPHEDLKIITSKDTSKLLESDTQRLVRVMDKTGMLVRAIVFSTVVQLSMPSPHEVSVVLFVKVDEQLSCQSDNTAIECQAAEDAHTRLAFLMSTLTHPVRRVATGCSLESVFSPIVAATMDGSPDLPHFALHRLLHTQMGVPQRRICDVCSRCDMRLQGDLLRSSSLVYTWKNTRISAEFYKIGSKSSALMSIHRPLPHKERDAETMKTTHKPDVSSSLEASKCEPMKTRSLFSLCRSRCTHVKP